MKAVIMITFVLVALISLAPVQGSPWDPEGFCTEQRLRVIEQHSRTVAALSLWTIYYYSADKPLSTEAEQQLDRGLTALGDDRLLQSYREMMDALQAAIKAWQTNPATYSGPFENYSTKQKIFTDQIFASAAVIQSVDCF